MTLYVIITVRKTWGVLVAHVGHFSFAWLVRRFKTWYVQKNRGGFDYYLQWPGFNIPSWVLDDARAGKLGSPLRPQVGRADTCHRSLCLTPGTSPDMALYVHCTEDHWRKVSCVWLCTVRFLLPKKQFICQCTFALNHLTHHIPPGRCFSACCASRCKICHRKLREGVEYPISDTCKVFFAVSECIRGLIDFILGYSWIFVDLRWFHDN